MTISLRLASSEILAATPSPLLLLAPLLLAFGCPNPASGAVRSLAASSQLDSVFAVPLDARGSEITDYWLRHVAEDASDDRADLPPGAKITREQASATALRVVAGEVTSVDVERKLGRIVYTVEIMTAAGGETDVFVDVETGEVLGTD